MKKIVSSIALYFLVCQEASACIGSWPMDDAYFNLFSQEIIRSPEYYPFLLSYHTFYGPESTVKVEDENVKDWEKYFNEQLSYEETDDLVKVMPLRHLQNWKEGLLTHPISEKLGKDFYTKYQDALDYLIKAKELEPYMYAKYVPNEYAFYSGPYTAPGEGQRNASELDYETTVQSLLDGYNSVSEAEIKLRYAYQLVRFNHYNLKFDEAVEAFDTYAAPLELKNAIYWNALDQKAGALRGLKKMDEANWDFFQVFIHRKTNKASVYSSLKFAGADDFASLLARAGTVEEKNMAYFLLAYDDYNNPVSIMDTMIANNADSDILKVLAARAINQLERNFLPVFVNDDCAKRQDRAPRLPFHCTPSYSWDRYASGDFTEALEETLQNAQMKSQDKAFWDISIAYVKFLRGDHASSMAILSEISTSEREYQEQITKMKMLNDIVSQEEISPEFENSLLTKYAYVFEDSGSLGRNRRSLGDSTKYFILDILANRYFMEHQDAKSFLLHNRLSELQYNPDSDMLAKVQEFYKKPGKTAFEEYIAKSFEGVGDVDSFFSIIYGDRAMRAGDFPTALSFYQAAENFPGIPRTNSYGLGEYDGFRNISSLVFGRSQGVSYGSSPHETMLAEDTAAFPFLAENMDKMQLAAGLVQLKKIGEEDDPMAPMANRLIGNLMYNTSILGYYRHLFVMITRNGNSSKFYFRNSPRDSFHFYYKGFSDTSYVEPSNFDIAIGYFQKALQQSADAEDKAKILFQMAQAEQGKYYQWAAAQREDMRNNKGFATREEFNTMLLATRDQKFRTYFAELKQNYRNTSEVKALETNCLYFSYYMMGG